MSIKTSNERKAALKTVAIKNNKMATKKQKTEDDFYFVSIKRPLELRRQILECSKKTIYSLQDYQRLFLLRERKAKDIRKLDALMRELVFLNSKLNEKLPKHKEFVIKKQVMTPKQANVHLSAKKPVKEKTELERLEDSLGTIEKKLKGLQ